MNRDGSLALAHFDKHRAGLVDQLAKHSIRERATTINQNQIITTAIIAISGHDKFKETNGPRGLHTLIARVEKL